MKLKEQRGAASILIIFMMMILVTLGAFAITSANANLRFSERSREWNASYYRMDAVGEEFLTALDGKLALAEKAAVQYFESGNFNDMGNTEIPEPLKSAISTKLAQARLQNGYDDIAILESINNIYMYYAVLFINTLANFEAEVYTIDNEPFIDGALVEATIRPPDETSEKDRHIVISVWVEPVSYSASEVGGRLSLKRVDDSLRYSIDDWYEYQEPIDEAPEEQLWDGSL